MKTIEVPGGTITIRERADLRVKDKRLLLSKIANVGPVLKDLPFDDDGNLDEAKATEKGLLTEAVINGFYELAEVAIAARVVSWSLPAPVPSTVAEVEELPADIYEAVQGAVLDGIQDMLSELSFEPSNPTAPGFSETPTRP